MRDLGKVIDSMLEIIPGSEEELISELKDVRGSYLYSAPELATTFWELAFEHLCEHVFPNLDDKTGWQEKVRRIWVDEKE